MAKEIKTEIKIMARPEKVWSILMNREDYPSWNPFIKSIKGSIQKGEKITVKMKAPEMNEMTFKPKVISVIENQELEWLGHLGIRGLFDGRHRFEILENGDGSSTFIHSEQFRGILVPFFRKMLDHNTKRGFVEMNIGLKEQAEKQ